MNSKRRDVVLFLSFVLFVFIFLSSCGTTAQENTQPTNYYQVVHQVPRNNADIKAASITNGTLYYITNTQSESRLELPGLLMGADTENEETLLYQNLLGTMNTYMQQSRGSFRGIQELDVSTDGIAVMTVDFLFKNSDFYCCLICKELEGDILWHLTMPETFYYSGGHTLSRDANGYTYVLTDNGDLLVASPEGELLYYEEESCYHTARLADGRVVLIQLSSDKTQWQLCSLDPKTGSKSALCTLPVLQEGDPRNGGFYTGNSEYDLFCTTDLSLYGIKLGTEDKPGTATQILSWINCDVDGTGILAFTALEDKNFSVLTYSDDMGADLAFLEWSEVDPNAEKTTLTIACRQLPEALSRAIQKFNRQSADCRVVVRDYTTVAASGIDRLTTDLNAGNMPDLFCMEGVDEQTLVNKGYLEDLWPYIDNDEQLGREALVEPVFNAMSVNGKLYTVTRGFTLESTLGLKTLVGDEPGWSFAEFAQLVKDNPDLECLGNIYYDRDYALEEFLELYTGNYIDWEAGTASFDSAEFIEAMEYLMLYPEEINRKRGDAPHYWMPEGKELFTCYELRGLSEYESAKIDRVGHSDIAVWKGYPGLGGNGSAIRPQLQLAMASTGEHKEAAWSFLRTVLLPENQDFDHLGDGYTVNSMPTNKAVFDEMVQDYVKGWADPNYKYHVTNAYGENIFVDPWTQEDIDAFYALIEGATVVVRPQETIAAILRDEMNRFFAGQQDAQTAAKAIQNRVQLCLDEQG